MKVLVAEDDATSRRMLEALLRRWEYEPVITCDGNEAWEALNAPDAPRIAILDWMMPGLDGAEICRRARNEEDLQSAYLILLTVRGQSEDIVKGLEAGADDYVTKPFERNELRARLAVGRRVTRLQSRLADHVRELQSALDHVETLQGLLPMCARCRKVRNDRQVWQRLEEYIEENAGTRLTHSLCPECLKKDFPEYTQGNGAGPQVE